jgi:hypothetical protein
MTNNPMIAFLPWLTLREPVSCFGVRFVPRQAQNGAAPAGIGDVLSTLSPIFSAYRDVTGNPIDTGVVVCMDGKPDEWNISDADMPLVRRATLALFLACMSRNDYVRGWGSYVNSANFELVWQRFTYPISSVTLVARRRDGHQTTGGYSHQEIRITEPLQARLSGAVGVDLRLLNALDASNAQPVGQRIQSALAFVALASTDSGVMLDSAEVILIVSAVEQLIDGAENGREFCKRVSRLLDRFGAVRVADSLTERVVIVIDPKYEVDQKQWWLHKKWAEEIYDLRSSFVHLGSRDNSRSWGWTNLEHLLMSAFTFPLLVKLLLNEAGTYELHVEDEAACLAIDHILAAPRWFDRDGGPLWTKAITDAHMALTSRRVRQSIEASFQENSGC